MVKTGQEQDQIGRRHRFALAGNDLYKGEMKWRHIILMLVLYIWNGWRARFYDKRRCTHFRDGRRNGRHVHFCDKRRCAPRNTCLLYLHNRRCVIGTCVSLLSQKRVRLGYKLNWDAPKRRSSPFYPQPSHFRSSMRARLISPDQRWSHLRTSPICVSDLSFLRSDIYRILLGNPTGCCRIVWPNLTL
jgi:hypothetical protein